LEREAAEARFERAMYWINIKNRAMLYFVIAFLSMDVVFLTLLIWFGGVR
jgi:hypothetical protein